MSLQWEDVDGVQGDDRKLGVRFQLRAQRSAARSQLAGRPVFDEVEYIEIVSPGDKFNIVCRPVTLDDKRRFAPQYNAWSVGRQRAAQSGMPLDMVAWITRAQVEELACLAVHTLEQLAGMSDERTASDQTLQALRQRAQDQLQAADAAAPLAQLRAELEEKERRLAAAEEALAEVRRAQQTPSNVTRKPSIKSLMQGQEASP
jgi:hypothetical protein